MLVKGARLTLYTSISDLSIKLGMKLDMAGLLVHHKMQCNDSKAEIIVWSVLFLSAIPQNYIFTWTVGDQL